MSLKCTVCETGSPKYLIVQGVCRFCKMMGDFNDEIGKVNNEIGRFRGEFINEINCLKGDLADLKNKILIKTNPFVLLNSDNCLEDCTGIDLEALTTKVYGMDINLTKKCKSIEDKLINLSVKSSSNGEKISEGINGKFQDQTCSDTGNDVGDKDKLQDKNFMDKRVGKVRNNSKSDNNPWCKVINGVKTYNYTDNSIGQVPVKNKYECLSGLEEDDCVPTRLISDCILEGQTNQFCVRDKRKRKNVCYKKAKIDKIIDEFDRFTTEDCPDTNYIVHTGVFDIMNVNKRIPELISNYKTLINKFKTKGRSLTCSAVLPLRNSHLGSRIYNFNSQLKELCKNMGVRYFSAYDKFVKPDFLYSRDSLHLSKVGAARMGRLLNDELKEFFRGKKLVAQGGPE